jgi:predicted transposase/invertase (TIGR01784 family)
MGEMFRETVLAERKAFFEEGREEGREEGIEEGREEAQTHIIERMILNKMETADIRKITGVSLHRIEGIRKGVGPMPFGNSSTVLRAVGPGYF